jgi:hypothetical protein
VKMYSTTDVAASVHRASGQFTHVVLNRSYALHRPVFFDSSTLLDLPICQRMPYADTEDRQTAKWKEQGGVLIDPTGMAWECDAALLVECPLRIARIDQVTAATREYAVIPNPVSWTVYDEYIDLHRPTTEHLQELWFACGGRQMSNAELSEASGWPVAQVMYMKAVFEPKEHWYIQKRLAPERDEFLPAWDWLVSGCLPRSEITKAGHRAMVEEMGRFGYVSLKKVWHYPAETPNWKRLRKEREQALKDLAAVRSLVESLPDHLQT